LAQWVISSAESEYPPLIYPRVLDLCREFPDLEFSLNGGVNDIGHVRSLLGFEESQELRAQAWGLDKDVENFSIPSNFHGAMIGRGAMNTPVMLWDVDHQIYHEDPPVQATRRSLLEGYRDYLQDAYPPGDTDRSVGVVHMAVKPTLGLFAGLRGNRAYRATLDTLTRDKTRRLEGPAHCLEEAMRAVEAANPGILDEPLAPTQAFQPGKRPSGDEDVAAGGGKQKQKQESKESNRGKKRKAAQQQVDEAAGDASTQCTGGDAEAPTRPESCTLSSSVDVAGSAV